MEDTIIKTIEYKGCTISIKYDLAPESPREWDNLGHMVCWHSRYNLGDKHTFADKDEFLESIDPDTTYLLPLYLYDHSGITIKTSPFNDDFDSGLVGFIYLTQEEAQKEFPTYKNWKRLKNHVYKILKQEVETYDQFLTGQVYGYETTNEQGEDIDSVWGFYGEDDCIEEAKNAIDYYIEHEKPKARDKSISRMT